MADFAAVAPAVVTACSLLATAVVAAAVADAAVLEDCLRLWFARRCLPCFLEAMAAVEV